MGTVYIGNAVHDENGKAKGGAAGDQTGREVLVQKWYKSPKTWRVFRPKPKADAEKIAAAMQAACDNPNIGYDQGSPDRNTFYTEAAKVGFDPSRINTPCETDCSASVRVCCAAAGIKLGNFNTVSEPGVLLKSGRFTEMVGKEYSDSSDLLCRGDILCTSIKGHTAVVLNDGSKVKPDPAPAPEPAKKTVTMIKVKGTVRCRYGNGTNYPQIKPTVGPKTNPSGLLPYLGQAVESPYWYKTEWQGEAGYISSKKSLTELVEIEQPNG